MIMCFFDSLDNSDWMRNGDYIPNRLDAQNDAGKCHFICLFSLVSTVLCSASMLCNDRTSSNPENTVGIAAMAGQG